MVASIYSFFKAEPYAFEHCAAEIARLMDRNLRSVEVTQRSRDGGRDALGAYNIGPKSDPVQLDFALEAKCYAPGSGVGVRELSRLISRLRHRQFGILVTSSFLADQAYKELRDDGHPAIVISASDIVQILADAGHGTPKAVNS